MQSPESPTRPPRRPLPSWTTLLIPVLFAGGAALAHFQEPSTLNEQSIGGSSPQPTATSRLEPRPTTTPQPGGGSTAKTKTKSPLVMLVPGEDGLLHRRTVVADNTKPEPEEPTAPTTTQEQNIGRALTTLFQTAPTYFPKRAKVIGVEVPDSSDKPIIVDMGEGFADEEFWQGEETTGITLDAIVNTAIANSDQESSNQKVLFHMAGKPLVTLGQMDMRDPLPANPEAVAKS